MEFKAIRKEKELIVKEKGGFWCGVFIFRSTANAKRAEFKITRAACDSGEKVLKIVEQWGGHEV